jgi:hypothetical protein
VPADEALPKMPRYLLTGEGSLDLTDRMETGKFTGVRFGKHIASRGEEIIFCGWPTSMFRPLNEAAIAIAAYYEANRNNRALRSCAWNAFDDAPFLPELPNGAS